MSSASHNNLLKSRMLLSTLAACVAFLSGCRMGTVHVDSNPWFAAGSFGKQADIDAAVGSGANVNAHESKERYTPLHVAAMAGNIKAMQAMISKGAEINAVDEDGRTALMMSLFRQQSEAAIVLVEAGADLDVQDKRRKTALMFAAEQGLCTAIDAIVKKGANLNAQDRSDLTALMFAALKGQREAVEHLLKAGADTRMSDRRGRTALDLAIAAKKPDIADLIRAE